MDWNLDYPGKEQDLDGCEFLLLSLWSEKARLAEPDLFATKHWDYRHLPPVQATRLFAQVFVEEVRRVIRAHIDPTPPRVLPDGSLQDWEVIRKGDIFQAPKGKVALGRWERKIGSLIRARQKADRHGIPYTFFLRRAVRAIYFGRGYLLERTHLPDPAMLNGEEMFQTVLLAWADELEARIQVATHPRYLLANDVGHPDVSQHMEWIVSQLKRRSEPKFAIRKFIAAGLLSRQRAEAAFGAERVARALA